MSALWIGGQLGAISRACLSSFVMRGQPVHLYTYGQITDIPEGIQICDGNTILPESEIFRHKKTQSYALFSDLFRYELLRKKPGSIYVDCDIYCLKPIYIPEYGYLFGYEDEWLINGAVLALPADSVLLARLRGIFDVDCFMPEWYSGRRLWRLKIKRLFGFARHVSQMSWGVAGPAAITYYAQQEGVDHLAQPMDVLYPVPFLGVNRLLEPGVQLADITTENSLCVHLYNEVLRRRDLSKIPVDCILARMLRNEI